MTRLKRSSALLLSLATLAPTAARSAGFEKSVLWSGENAPKAGAVAAEVEGSEALFYNPAGLATGRGGGDASINFSPTFSKFEGSPSFLNAQNQGQSQFSPVAAGMVQYSITPQLGVGAGYYVTGGTRSNFKGINYSSLDAEFNTLNPDMLVDLKVTEFALGAAYEAIPGLKIGAAWRVTKVNATFSSVVYSPASGGVLANIFANDLEATRYNGFKVGAQYMAPEKNWGLGANFRSSVKFTAKGQTTGNRELGLANGFPFDNTPIVGGPVSISNAFPMQLTLGAFFQAGPWRILPQYDFTRYHENRELKLGGTVNVPNVNAAFPLSNITQNWKNMHNARLGFEYSGLETTVLRAGYVWTSQVTPNDYARATFASPGSGHTFTAGAGMPLGPIDLNLGGEYSISSGEGTHPTEVTPAKQKFSSRAYVGHVGAQYRF